MSLEGMSGCDVCRTIREETAQVDLVGMTAFSLDRYCVPALENGASCLVDKANVKGLCHVLCAIVNGRRADVKYASSESAQESHERLLTAKSGNVNYETFAKREREVMGLCSLGFTSKEIGIKLGIGEPTVKTYIRRVMKKLGAKNRTQAVIQWMEVNSREY
jgi:DNA-binding NarL/FixJ family response regulator